MSRLREASCDAALRKKAREAPLMVIVELQEGMELPKNNRRSITAGLT